MPVITGTMNLARILQTHLVNGETMLGGEGPAAAVNPLLLDGVMMATGALCVLLTEDGATFRCVDSQLRVILMPQLGIAPTVWRVEPRPDGGGASADSIPHRMGGFFDKAEELRNARKPGEGPEDERPLIWSGRELAAWLERRLLRMLPYPTANATMTRMLSAWMLLVRGGDQLPTYRNWEQHAERACGLSAEEWTQYYQGLFLS